MSKIEVDKIDPQSGTALEIGTSGDTVTVPSGVGLTLTNATLLLPTTINTAKLDSPSTTSQITYTVRFKSSNGTTVYYGEPGGTTTTLIAIEIGA